MTVQDLRSTFKDINGDFVLLVQLEDGSLRRVKILPHNHVDKAPDGSWKMANKLHACRHAVIFQALPNKEKP
jgi:hypothetical protein